MEIKARILFLLSSVFLLVSASVSGQNPSDIKERKIATLTVHEYFIEKGMDEPVVESFEAFNDKGNLTELKEFNSKGEVKRWEKYFYNEEGRLVEEIFLNEKGKVERREKSIYAEGLRVEKQYFNNRDKLYKRKIYEYEYRD